MKHEPLAKAIESVGGPKALARLLNISHQAVSQWKRCPPSRVMDIERITGISRHDLRPDVFRCEDERAA